MSLLHSFINFHLPRAKKGKHFSKSLISYSGDNKIFIIGLGNINGIITEQKKAEIEEQLDISHREIYFFTLFENIESFQKNSDSISWGSYVWLATEPEHTIHFDNKPKLKPKSSH